MDINRGIDGVSLNCCDLHMCRTADVLRDVSQLELLQAPGLPYIIPRDYASYPRLTGVTLSNCSPILFQILFNRHRAAGCRPYIILLMPSLCR